MTSDSMRDEMLKEAVDIAQRILAKELPPNEGCAQIGYINHALGWPDVLGPFGLLAHDQYDHEHLGITAENCIPDILSECQKLVLREEQKK